MVRNYVRKTTRQSWDEVSMQQAVLSVMNGDHGYKKAAEMYDVPQTTLERRVKRFKQTNDDGSAKYDIESACRKGFECGFKTVFTREEEAELAEYVQQMERMLFGLTPNELCALAFELAERNNKVHPFKIEDEAAGYDWYCGFMSRHPFLSLRKPEATSAARAQGFNRVAVNKFFDLLEEIFDKNNLPQDRIYNTDETGMTTVPKTMSRVISTKGKRQVGGLTSAERGQLITAIICCSASGWYMPPKLIFPRVRMKAELMDGAPPGSTYECHPSGWIQTHIFIDWMKEFIQFSGATKDRKVLLILDGHATHTKSLELIDLARKNGVIMLCLPPHCTHRMQPLDITFMKPLSVYYEQEVKKWLRQNPGRVVTQFQIAQLFGKAYLRSATMITAINGFSTPGIYPLDRNVFSEADFLAAEATDIPYEEDVTPATTTSLPLASAYSEPASSASPVSVSTSPTLASWDTPILVLPETEPLALSVSEPGPSAGGLSELAPMLPGSESSPPISTGSVPGSSTSTVSTPTPLLAISGPTPHVSSLSEPTPSTSSLSEPTPSTSAVSGPAPSTPKSQQRAFVVSPQMVVPYPKQSGAGKKRVSRQRGKTAILTSSPYKKALEENQSKKKAPVKATPATQQKPRQKKPPKGGKGGKGASKKSVSGEDVACLYCDGKWSESSESWVHCGDCENWAHYSCAGIDEGDRDPDYLCELCLQTDD